MKVFALAAAVSLTFSGSLIPGSAPQGSPVPPGPKAGASRPVTVTLVRWPFT
jgi:hypothetical protein